MTQNKFTLNLSIPCSINCETGGAVVLSEIKEVMERYDCEDGRHPFSREMMMAGLGEMIKTAVGNAVMKFMQQKHGADTMEANKFGGETNVAYARTMEWMQHDFSGVSIQGCEWAAEVK